MFDENGDRVEDYDETMNMCIRSIVDSQKAAESIISEKKFVDWCAEICRDFPEVSCLENILKCFLSIFIS